MGVPDDLRFDAAGLIPAVVQQHDTGQVLMVGYMDRTALERTLTSGRVWFWSRSRQEYWR
ncbi:MAG: phosphoribosyl-AMP cyclohydrolase, partial [Bifidobacteriaceae bacterium]|nr:phosphoribosyl-AMP cyclohydrolase [Bifidobacteriaceae bacterium]